MKTPQQNPDPQGTTGQRVVAARLAKGIKQEDLAKKIKMSRPTLSHIERDIRNAKLPELALIANVCKTQLECLMIEDDIMQNIDIPEELIDKPLFRGSHHRRVPNANGTTGQRIRYAREKCGYSRQQFAVLSRIAGTTLSSIEADQKRPSLELLETFARISDMDVFSLMDEAMREHMKKQISERKDTPIKRENQFLGGKKLREIREKKKWTTRFLAQKADVNHGSIMYYERGKRNIDKVDALRCANALGVEPQVIAPQYYDGSIPVETSQENETIGERLVRLRNERALSREQLIKELKISFSGLCRLERNEVRDPNFFIMRDAAKFFDVSIDYIGCLTNVRESWSTKSNVLPFPIPATEQMPPQLPPDARIRALEEVVRAHETTIHALSLHCSKMGQRFDDFLIALQACEGQVPRLESIEKRSRTEP